MKHSFGLDALKCPKCAHLGTRVRYADDFVVMCSTEAQVADEVERVADERPTLFAGQVPELAWAGRHHERARAHAPYRIAKPGQARAASRSRENPPP